MPAPHPGARLRDCYAVVGVGQSQIGEVTLPGFRRRVGR